MATDFGKLDIPVSFNPQTAIPVDARTCLSSYSDALAAAQSAASVGSSDSRYYVGQIIHVVDQSDAKYYKITSGGGLALIPDADQLSGFASSDSARKYGIRFDENGAAYVRVPWSGDGGGGGGSVDIDGATIKSNLDGQIYVDPSALSATSSSFGTVKLGYSGSGKNYALQLNSEGKAYVNVPWESGGGGADLTASVDNSTIKVSNSKIYVDPSALSATSSSFGTVKLGYAKSGTKFPVEASSGKLYVDVNNASAISADVKTGIYASGAFGYKAESATAAGPTITAEDRKILVYSPYQGQSSLTISIKAIAPHAFDGLVFLELTSGQPITSVRFVMSTGVVPTIYTSTPNMLTETIPLNEPTTFSITQMSSNAFLVNKTILYKYTQS